MATTTPDSFAGSVARLRDSDRDGVILGSGFVVGPRLVLTCAHVIRGLEPGGLWVEFPQAEHPGGGGVLGVAGRVRVGSVDDRLDSALVDLTDADPHADADPDEDVDGDVGGVPVPLLLRRGLGQPGRTWRSFGFPIEDHDDGTFAGGVFDAQVRRGDRDVVQLVGANAVSVGFSGAPLVDGDGFVVAMISTIPGVGEHGRLRGVAHGIRAVDLQDRYEQLRVEQECPYPGLRAFTKEQAAWFYGRDEAVGELLTALEDGPRVQMLLGASGSGKSSLVSAGLFPAIQQGRAVQRRGWECVRVQASDGMPALLEAIASVRDTAQLVVVDQFEEVLLASTQTINEDGANDHPGDGINAGISAGVGLVGPGEARAVVAAVDELIGAGIAGQLLLVARSDFYATMEEVLPRLLRQQKGLIPLPGALSAQNLREVIEEPARRQGWNVSPRLTDQLIHALLAGRSAAPLTDLTLLAVHLRELWSASLKVDNTLTERSPGADRDIRVAFASACDQSYRELSDQDQGIAREVLLDLVQLADPDKGTPAIKRRRSISFLNAAYPGAARVITHLADRRIVATTDAGHNSDPVAELIHDSLIERWDLLREWLAADPELRAWRERIDPRAERWHTSSAVTKPSSGRPRIGVPEWLRRQHDARMEARDQSKKPSHEGLLTGSDLAEAARWREDPRVPLTTRGYVRASLRREGQRKWQRRGLVAALAVATVAMMWQRSVAVTEARTAIANSLAARSMSFSSTDPAAAQAFAIASLQQAVTEPTIAAALNATSLPMYPPLATLTGHTDEVGSVVFSPDGTRLASASADRTARVWDAASGETVATMTGHTDQVRSVVFSPDGTRLATVSRDGIGRVWDVTSGMAVATLTGHTGSVESVVFSPDGTRLATVPNDGTGQVWDATSGKSTATPTGPTRSRGPGRSPDGTRVATFSRGGSGSVLDATTGKAVATLTGHTRPVVSVVFSPDGTRVATASYDRTGRVWDAFSGKTIATLTGHTGAVWSVVFSPDGTQLATVSRDGTGRVWDAASGKTIATLTGHTDEVWSVAFSQDGRRLATASADGTGRVWDAASGKTVTTMTGHTGSVGPVVFSPDGTRLATASVDRSARVWDVASGKTTRALNGHTGTVRSVVFSPDGTHLATADDDTARVWDPTTGKTLTTLKGHTGTVKSVALSPDGTRVATASNDHTGRVWDAVSGATIATLTGHTRPVVSVVFSPDGTRLATASDDDTALVWDATTGATIATLTGHTGRVGSVVFSPDGTRLATNSNDDTARVWDVASGATIATLTGHTDPVNSVAFSPDGTQLATASGDGTGRVWDVASGATIATLTGHTDQVNSVVFSPDGTRLATASYDRTARVWDVASGATIATLDDHTDVVWSVVFSPDGTRLATTSRDGTAQVHPNVDPKTWPALLCARAGRNLTQDEWTTYLPSRSYQRQCGQWPSGAGAPTDAEVASVPAL